MRDVHAVIGDHLRVSVASNAAVQIAAPSGATMQSFMPFMIFMVKSAVAARSCVRADRDQRSRLQLGGGQGRPPYRSRQTAISDRGYK